MLGHACVTGATVRKCQHPGRYMQQYAGLLQKATLCRRHVTTYRCNQLFCTRRIEIKNEHENYDHCPTFRNLQLATDQYGDEEVHPKANNSAKYDKVYLDLTKLVYKLIKLACFFWLPILWTVPFDTCAFHGLVVFRRSSFVGSALCRFPLVRSLMLLYLYPYNPKAPHSQRSAWTTKSDGKRFLATSVGLRSSPSS